MLFMITQVHTPENCPRKEGGAEILYDRDAAGGPGHTTLFGTWWKQTTWKPSNVSWAPG